MSPFLDGQPFDKVCSCGEHIAFQETGRGGYVPICLEHGKNHFKDCPNANQYGRKARLDSPEPLPHPGPHQSRLGESSPIVIREEEERERKREEGSS